MSTVEDFVADERKGTEMTSGPQPRFGEFGLFLLLTLLPSVSMWVGLYLLKSAVYTFVLYHCLCLLPVIFLSRKFWLPTWKTPSLEAILALLLASTIFWAGALVLYEWRGASLLSDVSVLSLLNQLGYSKQLFWPLSLYAVFVNPLVEELYWRGVVLNKLEESRLPIRDFGLIWSSLAYAGFHYWIFRLVLFPGWAEIGTLLLAVYGVILAAIYKRTGSIITTAIAHGLITDMAAIVLLLDLFRRNPGVL